MRRQQLDAVNDSHRTLCPSSSSCCSFPLSSSAPPVVRSVGHRCRLVWKTCKTVLFVPLASTTALTSHCSSRLSSPPQSALTSHVRCFPDVPVSSSRVLDHLQSLTAPKPNCCGTVSRLVHSIRAPMSLAAVGPVACRCGSVYDRWAIFSRTATTLLGTGSEETGRGDETPLPARAYHALRAHRHQASPKNALTPQECTKGNGQRQEPSLRRLLYIQ